MPTFPWDRAIVVGASSGIGEAIARRLAVGGVSVAMVARRKDVLERICGEIAAVPGSARAIAFEHDVRCTDEVSALFQQITTTLGGLDLIVYSAGVMNVPRADEYSTEADLDAIEINFSGAVVWLNEAAMRFSRARAGTIVGISSVAGDRGRTRMPIYHATKAAVDTYLESLRARLARKGVRVVTVKPGYVRTAMVEDQGISGPLVISADTAAEQILRAAQDGKRIAYIPWWWRPIMLVIKAIPDPIFERLNL